MASHERSIEVAVPLTTAYDQWTQFEDFPQFMEGVEEVRQLNDTLTHWRVSIAAPPGSSTPRSPSSAPMSGWLGVRSRAPLTPVS